MNKKDLWIGNPPEPVSDFKLHIWFSGGRWRCAEKRGSIPVTAGLTPSYAIYWHIRNSVRGPQ